MRTFRETLIKLDEGTMKLPKVIYQGVEVDAVMYQLLVSRMHLQIMCAGMKVRNVKLKDLKAFYELKGNSAKEVYSNFITLFNQVKNEYYVSN